MAALSGDLTPGARGVCLDLLLRLVDTDDEDSAEACQAIARQGIWGLYRDHPDLVVYAYLVLRAFETDHERLRACRDSGLITLREPAPS
ncbi:hypothetical protein [Streptomyces panaciradicis]|uniref:hypothetical protein n=1 Tax=Streptomyces panaciradicis TaxID=1470261 RepID=UPI00201D20B9|nr:hypothetical protein [Streptomyces panaciradicis]MCL6672944.1 hypothetical protein [Streptomyces panaciradicis]